MARRERAAGPLGARRRGGGVRGLPAALLRSGADARAGARPRLLGRRRRLVRARPRRPDVMGGRRGDPGCRAVIASGPISYLFNGPDWVRYLPARTSGHAIFWTVFLSSGVIALFLSVMGVLLASRGDMSDPVGGVEPFVPGWLFVLFILSAVGGSIANNVVAYYSSGLCLQSIGVPLERY